MTGSIGEFERGINDVVLVFQIQQTQMRGHIINIINNNQISMFHDKGRH